MGAKKRDVSDHSANPTINGFQFQTCASISLLIDNIEEFISIKNEGLEDIIIEMPNKKYIYAEAKCSFDEDSTNTTKFMHQAFDSLLGISSKNDYLQLIYAIDYKKAFGERTYCDDFTAGLSKNYYQLSSINKELVEKYAPDNFPIEKYYVHYLPYFGKDMEKEEETRRKVKNYLSEKSTTKLLHPGKVFDTWKKYLDYNAANKDKNRFCSRSRIVWGMILHKIDTIEQDIIEETDEDYSDVAMEYETLLFKYSGQFELFSRIGGDYKKYNHSIFPRIASHEEYSNLFWTEYSDLLNGMSIPDRVKEKLLKLLIQTVLRKINVINGVKEEMKVRS